MLDKSVPFFRVILKRLPGTPVPEADLPAGYAVVRYQPGDERAWGEIEASVGEFDTPDAATDYFQANYTPYATETPRRTLFVVSPTGAKVGTFTAWWNYTAERRAPFMHWVAVRPELQGLGIGKALIAAGVHRMIELEGDCVMYIPTQTWSHRAIRLYRWAGFELELDEPAPGGYSNQTREALPVLEPLL